jgi:poly(ADP-ribose) glycohydrolase ARH3
MEKNFLDKFKGCLIGVAIGDTLGRPFEGKLREKIRSKFEFFEDFLWKNKKKFSSYTDDTQLTLHLAEALIKGGGFNMEYLIKEFVKWLEDPPIGPGYGCLTSIKKLKYGISWEKAASKSGGNGTLMRVSPIGLFYCNDLEKLLESADAQSLLTHSHPAATAGARMMARAVSYLTYQSIESGLDVDDFLDSIIVTTLNSQKAEWREFSEGVDLLRNNLDLTIESGLIKFSQLGVKSPYFIEQYLGKAFVHPYALSTMICSLFMFLKKYTSLEECVFELVTAGGDTDTVGAIGGALLGTYYGYSNIPDELLSFIKNRNYIIDVAERLYEGFQKRYL